MYKRIEVDISRLKDEGKVTVVESTKGITVLCTDVIIPVGVMSVGVKLAVPEKYKDKLINIEISDRKAWWKGN